jgi:hypothetical protein
MVQPSPQVFPTGHPTMTYNAIKYKNLVKFDFHFTGLLAHLITALPLMLSWLL